MKADCTLSINGRIGGEGKDIQKFLVAILFNFYVSSEPVILLFHMRAHETNSCATKRSFLQFRRFKSEI